MKIVIQVALIESYLRANKMFVDYSEVKHVTHLFGYYPIQHLSTIWFLNEYFSWTQPQVERVYSAYLELKLEDVEPCISGPKR